MFYLKVLGGSSAGSRTPSKESTVPYATVTPHWTRNINTRCLTLKPYYLNLSKPHPTEDIIEPCKNIRPVAYENPNARRNTNYGTSNLKEIKTLVNF